MGRWFEVNRCFVVYQSYMNHTLSNGWRALLMTSIAHAADGRPLV
jgi:hypothetical protein